ncbi:glycoside hydrolase family 65 protein [Agromyces sp. LHK192]|uniref:glycoside hydrolase family 65 protein n=1 Tax=Agromyces sp. LHK192 TaxID=2498704 RepID=UPI000FDB30E3|nr:glycosyl hydrolase family 65 protein [Agromyces sp. LHK192]
MSRPLPWSVEPWGVGLEGLDTERLAHRESVFALSNGHLGWRGNLDEGEPCGNAGSYLNGVFEEHPMPYAESGFGYPEHGQSVINIPDGAVIRCFVDDEPLDVRRGTVRLHRQRLDFRRGVLERELEWTTPAGRSVRIESTRMVSLEHRSIGAVRLVVEAVDRPITLTVQSELIANSPLPEVHPDDRVMEALRTPLEAVSHDVVDGRASLVHRTRRSGVGVAVSMDHRATAPRGVHTETEASGDLARTTMIASLGAGDRFELVKFVGHEWSAESSPATLRDRADAAVAEADLLGWDGLVAAQRARLDEFWTCADVEVEGPLRLQQAVRFALFHIFQSAARADLRPVPGKGLSGAGYAGHTFWDFEAFVLPVLTATAPDAAREGLRWRHATLAHARRRARELHLAGAAFAWRTVDGRESSGYWPASTNAFHLDADIAAAVVHYVRATGDRAFERDAGLELLVETARLWVALGRWDDSGGFHVDGVTGPDEYSAIVDDNAFTNLMAQLNLTAAADAVRRYPAEAIALGVGDAEVEEWSAIAIAMTVPIDQRRRIPEQAAGYNAAERWHFEQTASSEYPLQEHFPYFDLYRKQVVKQADLVLALHFRHDAFTFEEKAGAFAYAESLTVRDSSLSAGPQAVIAEEVGHLGLAADYLAEAATIDLDDVRGDAEDGLHLASLAGIWTALVAGFGGLRDSDEGLRFAPRLPDAIGRLAFGVKVGGETLRLEIRPDATTYRLAGGDPITLHHFGERFELAAGPGWRMPTPPMADPGPRPTQPPGREPRSFDAAFGS